MFLFVYVSPPARLSHFCVFLCVRVCVEKQKAELTQQHTEWVRQVTQRHMQQIEDLQNELKTHTDMMALQQVKSANQSCLFMDKQHASI